MSCGSFCFYEISVCSISNLFYFCARFMGTTFNTGLIANRTNQAAASLLSALSLSLLRLRRTQAGL